MKKLYLLMGAVLCINLSYAEIIPVGKFQLHTPATSADIQAAIASGLDVKVVRSYPDEDTGINYSTLIRSDAAKFCAYRYPNGGDILSLDDMGTAYVYLLDRHDTVNNYHWPFKYIKGTDPRWTNTKLADLKDGSGDLVNDLMGDPSPYEDHLVVCKTNLQ